MPSYNPFREPDPREWLELDESERLEAEGLDRHDAVHAIGAVLVGLIHELTEGRGATSAGMSNEACFAGLEKLTAEGWRQDR